MTRGGARQAPDGSALRTHVAEQLELAPQGQPVAHVTGGVLGGAGQERVFADGLDGLEGGSRGCDPARVVGGIRELDDEGDLEALLDVEAAVREERLTDSR